MGEIDFYMSENPSDPSERPDDEIAPLPNEKPLRQSWFYYVAGVFIMIALLGFILEMTVSWRPNVYITQPATSGSVGK